MNVLRNFSRDKAVHDDEWVLILEDDVALHPHVPPHQLADLITAGLEEAGRTYSPFVYLGLCAPSCTGSEVAIVTRRGATATFRNGCGGFCTHAYAVQKWIAARVPEYLKSMDDKQHQARTIDQALFRISNALNMSLLGSSLRSKDVRALGSVHAGLFYMKAFSDSLTTGDWDVKPKIVFKLEQWRGRIGNLAFEWASVVGLAVRAGIGSQAHFQVAKFQDTSLCPAAAFFRDFRLQRFSRDLMDVREVQPKCTIRFEEAGPNIYDAQAVNKLLKQIQAIDEGKSSEHKNCRMIEVSFDGYFQSYKYLVDAEAMIRQALQPPREHAERAERWMRKLRQKLARQDADAEWLFVGVQVRRGDKVHVAHFDSIYQPTEWDFYSEGMKLLAKRLLARHRRGNAKVAFVVTAGGSIDANSQDMTETKLALRSASTSHSITFVEGTEAMTDFALLVSMDALVVSSSSFGWWAGYVSKAGVEQGLVVAPKSIYRPHNILAQGYKAEDYYPPNWSVLNNSGTDFPTF